MLNTNSQLDPQSPESRLAHISPEEMPPDAVDHAPDPYHDAEAYARDTAGDAVPDDCDGSHRGWPGDGSGEDDLADLMAHGDEGCCDGPECDDAPDSYLDAAYEDRFDTDFYGGE